MKEHLSQRQLEEYSQQQLRAPELIGVDDHLAVCADCRRRVEAALPGAVASLYEGLRADAASPPESHDADVHLSFDQIAGHVDESRAPSGRQFIADHLASCARCARQADDLRAFKAASLSQPGRVPTESDVGANWWGKLRARLWHRPLAPVLGWSAVGVVIYFLAGWLLSLAFDVEPPPPEIAGGITSPSPAPAFSPMVTPTPEASSLLAQLNDRGVQVTLDRQGSLTGLGDLPSAYQQMVKDALLTQKLTRPSTLDELNRRSSSLMGADEHGHQFSLTNPVGKVVLADRPVFSWTPLDGAAGYVVEVYDGQFNLVAKSAEVTSARWMTTRSLARGQSYSWQVKAIKDGQQFQAPRPPAPQARFRVLDSQQADEIARARRTYAKSHLMLGLLYARAGLLDEAARELRALQTANPNSEVVRRLLASIRSQ